MSPRKDRIVVVLDTNVLVGYYLSTRKESANCEVYRLWRTGRKLQLVVSDEVATEYLEVLRRLAVSDARITSLEQRLQRRETVTHVNLGARPTASRDPDDNIMLAAAVSGKAKFLITNDRDLLDIAVSDQRKYRFEIVTPMEFITRMEE